MDVLPKKLADGRYACQNCLKKFTRNPSPKAVKEPKFCSDNCRKEFHKNGAFSLHKVRGHVEKFARDSIAASHEEWRLEILAKIDELRQSLKLSAFERKKKGQAA